MTNSILCMLLQVLFAPYFVPEVFGVHDFGKKVDQKDVDVCCQMYNAQLHTTHLSYTVIQRTAKTYWRIYGIISVSYYGVTSMYITLPESAPSRHILAITFMIQKLYGTQMVGFCLIMYKYSYKNYVNGNKVFGLRYSDFCSFLSEPLTFHDFKTSCQSNLQSLSLEDCAYKPHFLIAHRPIWD